MVLTAALLASCVSGAPMAAIRSPTPAEQSPESAVQAPDASDVRLLTIDGVINPLAARYLERELERAAASDEVTLVVLRLDTPGGLETSMRRMVEAILGARVPVVVHVAPSGARAASAGMFLVLAAHIAAMAPGTNIGAAHPVTLGGEQPDTTLEEKMVSDAAALARAIARQRGRNAAWAERAVRRSVSITAGEALESDVVDLVVERTDSLLARIDGRRVRTAAGTTVLRTAGARITARPMSLPERILHAITDPNIAYLLVTIGVIGIIAELYNPGIILPGVTGAISLILAFVAFGSLPVNWAGVALLALGIALFIIDLATEGIGVVAIGGLVAFVLGSLMLYSPFSAPSPAMPEARVSPPLIAAVTAGMAALLVLVGRALLRARREPVAIGAAALVGRAGVATDRLDPRGSVRIDSEVWSATVEEGADAIAPGEPVEVVGLEGVVLRVRRRRSERTPPTEEEV